jgi:hypothetical protein
MSGRHGKQLGVFQQAGALYAMRQLESGGYDSQEKCVYEVRFSYVN